MVQGYDSRFGCERSRVQIPVEPTFFSSCGKKKKKKKLLQYAVTRIRTWVTAATTQGPNHQTITANRRLSCKVWYLPKYHHTGTQGHIDVTFCCDTCKQVFVVQRLSHLSNTQKVPGSIPGENSSPTWSNGQDIWLSPRRPGFNSRRGNPFTPSSNRVLIAHQMFVPILHGRGGRVVKALDC